MKKLIFIMIPAILSSCSIEPKPIKYGRDACHFCEMTIVSKSHSALALTSKGKQYNYDAIECMVHDELKNPVPKDLRQVSDLSAPGNMIPVENAIFVINDSINSPMGANLGAIREDQSINRNAELLNWEELLSFFKEEDSMSLSF